MRVLLDTQCWLWFRLDPDRLNPTAQGLFEDQRHPLYLSAASAWEIAVKSGLGALSLPEPPERYVPSSLAQDGITALPVEHAHALRVATLPRLHGDPFDRLLVAQAQLERMTILTADSTLALYDVEIVWGGLGPPPRALKKKARRKPVGR